MNGCLTGGAKCALKVAKMMQAIVKFDCPIAKYEIECSPQRLYGDKEIL